ncbi:MAG: amidohydrolase/deacetylase family metallohydrolase [Chitinophagaceae bacterium]|nr:amidohydrolase/deacetylase family metallohydrolase [Chitinophagaceae bacterium]
MKKILIMFIALMFAAVAPSIAQSPYSIVIKGGHVIDPKNGIDGIMDVAINDGRIALLAPGIDATKATQVIHAEGMYITPGLIDIHTHVFWGVKPNHQYADGNLAIQPDGFTFRNGVTTIVDAGSSGWRNFSTFKSQTIDNAKTRVLAFLNIVGEGMRGGLEQNENDMDPKMSALIARQNKDYIVGFKLAHYDGYDWTPTDRTVQAGRLAGNLPVMIDFGGSQPPLSLRTLFMDHLRPGDIFTHCYAELSSREYVYDLEKKKVKPFVWEAKTKGIIFDVGYGGISFAYSQAIPSIKEGFYPNSISTDLHVGSMNAAMKDMLTTMSKFLAMGMDLKSVIEASTWSPAKEIQRQELGNLSVGAGADIAILSLRQGSFGLFDYTGYKIKTNNKLECELTLRDGKIVYDLNGIADPMITPAAQRSKKTEDAFVNWYDSKSASNGLKLTPSGSINQQEFFRQYRKNPKWWDEAFDFLNNKDLLRMKPGDYVIDSGNVIAHISEGPAKEMANIKWEAHRDFNDLQYIIKGKARMGVASIDDPQAVTIAPYAAETDIAHFTNDMGQYYDAGPETFFIFSPQEMHRPAIKVPANNNIKKIVIKVRVP